jgi:hypothetical protein
MKAQSKAKEKIFHDAKKMCQNFILFIIFSVFSRSSLAFCYTSVYFEIGIRPKNPPLYETHGFKCLLKKARRPFRVGCQCFISPSFSMFFLLLILLLLLHRFLILLLQHHRFLLLPLFCLLLLVSNHLLDVL